VVDRILITVATVYVIVMIALVIALAIHG